MKKLLSLLIVLIILFSCASMERIPPEKLYYQEIIEVPGKTKSDIYDGCLHWMARAFNSSNDVIQYKNPDTGEIVGKGVLMVNYTITPVATRFSLILETKDGKARATFKDMAYVDNISEFKNRLQLDKFSKEARKVTATLRAALSTQQKKDW